MSLSLTSKRRDKLARETKQSSKALNLPNDQSPKLEDLLLEAYKNTREKQKDSVASQKD